MERLIRKAVNELRNKSVRRRKLNEGPICGSDSGKPCGEACGDGYTWQDSPASNSCICNHTSGKVCHTTGGGPNGSMYSDGGGGKIKGGKLQNTGLGDRAKDSRRLSERERTVRETVKQVMSDILDN
tara:strand:- start:295 stop:675 length:381 start_codon:yes stop_codon:yes gene_type:complete